MTKAQKRIIKAAMAIHRESGNFPVKTFTMQSGKVIERQFKGDFAWMNELVAACEAYARVDSSTKAP